jgi:carbonic anhydrase
MKSKPLMVVLVSQVVVLVAALGFLAARSSSAATTAHREVVEAAPEHVVMPKLEPAHKPAPPQANGEWAAFPGEEPAAAPASPSKLGEEREAAPSAARHPPGAAEAPVSFETLLSELSAGNSRYVEGVSRQRDAVGVREALAGQERASAVVVTCTDSRVVPELLFDQPLGSFSVVRLPGAQLDDLAVKAVEDSVTRLHARAVLVVGHLGCHHVRAALTEAAGKAGPKPGSLAAQLTAPLKALDGDALDEAATATSVTFSAKELRRRSKLLAHSSGVPTLRVLYSPRTGSVRWLDAEEPAGDSPGATRTAHR